MRLTDPGLFFGWLQCDAVDPADVKALAAAVKRAAQAYKTPEFSKMIKAGMAQDLSWKVGWSPTWLLSAAEFILKRIAQLVGFGCRHVYTYRDPPGFGRMYCSDCRWREAKKDKRAMKLHPRNWPTLPHLDDMCHAALLF